MGILAAHAAWLAWRKAMDNKTAIETVTKALKNADKALFYSDYPDDHPQRLEIASALAALASLEAQAKRDDEMLCKLLAIGQEDSNTMEGVRIRDKIRQVFAEDACAHRHAKPLASLEGQGWISVKDLWRWINEESSCWAGLLVSAKGPSLRVVEVEDIKARFPPLPTAPKEEPHE